jgi:predicted nucleotidyltransferase
VVISTYPATQAIYLLGSYGTGDERQDSDIDIALLLPHDEAKAAGSLAMSPLRFELEQRLGREVDLINLRLVSTVLRKEVVAADRRIFCANAYAVDEFEMLTLSLYAKLNDERREILEQFFESGRAYPV